MSIERLDELKKTLDDAYLNGTNVEWNNAIVELQKGYQEVFGDKYELMMHLMINNYDHILCDAL